MVVNNGAGLQLVKKTPENNTGAKSAAKQQAFKWFPIQTFRFAALRTPKVQRFVF